MNIDFTLEPGHLSSKLERFWSLSGDKIFLIDKEYDSITGSPVFTVEGKYSTRGWTEWTQGFQFGSSILQFDASGESSMWGDYHMREAALYLSRIIKDEPYYTFFGCVDPSLIK